MRQYIRVSKIGRNDKLSSRVSAISSSRRQAPRNDPENGGDEKPMMAPIKPGVTLAHLDGPVIETERLKLRQWCGADIAPNTAMLSDPGTARFITVDGKPVTDELVGWRNAAV